MLFEDYRPYQHLQLSKMATTVTTNTSNTGANVTHFSSEMRKDSTLELTKRLAQMQIKSTNTTIKRQPTIVCEDIATDNEDSDFECDDDQMVDSGVEENDTLLLRSASTASLTVPVVCEDQKSEKRRPPLPDEEDRAEVQ